MRTYARAEDELSKELLPRESHVLKKISLIFHFTIHVRSVWAFTMGSSYVMYYFQGALLEA